ncbi:MAG: type IV toxin-antitoxin system AbiEi family antitoxin domain-containing protein [Solirubrobacteraceae bacterium]|nr:type IV toxin-antitoxin system AbiEi family antitoxin domain-containing protein [Solirubrobacteraceae bacterium]
MDEQADQTSPDASIALLAARQHGVVSWRQLIDAGLGRGAIDHRCRIGWLHRVHRGVFAVGHPPLTREARWMAAVLACGDRAGLSHACATALWEIRPYTGIYIDVTVPSRTGRSSRDRIRLHRSSIFDADDITTHRAIPVTTIARTLLDVAVMLSEPALARTIEQTEIRRLFDLAAVEQTIARHPNHRGVTALRRALALYRDDEFSRSELEKAFLALCDAHGIPRPLVNHIVEGKEVDFFWPDHRLIVETDGRATHFTIAAYEGDRARDAYLLTLGFRVLRFTELQVRFDGATVAARLAAVLATSASR